MKLFSHIYHQDFSYFSLIWKARETKPIDITKSRARDKLYILESPVLPGHSEVYKPIMIAEF